MIENERVIRRACIVTFVSAIALVAPSLSGADGLVYAQSEEDIERAKELFNEGRAASKDEDHARAAKLFEESYNLSKRAQILFFVAEAYEKSGDLYLAQQYYQRYLDEIPDADNADAVLDLILSLQKRIDAEMARVTVSSKTDGRDVFVDGASKPRCQTPCQLVLKPGSYAISVRADGMPSVERELEVSAGDKDELEVELRKEKVGFVRVDTGADGMVRVGGVEARLPMSAPVKVPAGTQTVEISGSGGSWSGEVEVGLDETLNVYVPVEDLGGGGSPLQIASIASIGVGAGFLIGGLLMGQQTASTYALVEAQASEAAGADARLIEQGKGQQLTANLLMGAGAVGLLAGGGLLAWDFIGSSEPAPSPSEGSQASDEDSSGADIDLLE